MFELGNKRRIRKDGVAVWTDSLYWDKRESGARHKGNWRRWKQTVLWTKGWIKGEEGMEGKIEQGKHKAGKTWC